MATRRTSARAEMAARWSGRAILPAGYEDLLEDFKARVRSAQVKAAVSVNGELIAVYLYIGRQLADKEGSPT